MSNRRCPAQPCVDESGFSVLSVHVRAHDRLTLRAGNRKPSVVFRQAGVAAVRQIPGFACPLPFLNAQPCSAEGVLES